MELIWARITVLCISESVVRGAENWSASSTYGGATGFG